MATGEHWGYQRCGRYAYQRVLMHSTNPDHLVPSPPSLTDIPPLRLPTGTRAGAHTGYGDQHGAATGWTTGCEGTHRGSRCPVLADATEHRGLYVRRRRTRRHPGGPRLRQRTDEEFRPYSVGARQTRVTLRR